MCGALIFRNGHEVSSRVGDMSRTFNHLFVVINMLTQFSYTCLRAGKRYIFHHEDTVDVDTSFQQCETHQRYQTRKQVRGGEKNSMSKGRPKSKGMWGIRKSILFFLII